MNDRADYSHNLSVCLLQHNLERHPDKIAYFHDDEAISYRQLGDAVYRFAALLREKGIKRDDSVLIALRDSPVFITTFLATTILGAIAVAVSTSLSRELYDYIIDDSKAKLALLSPSVVEGGFPIKKLSCIIYSEKFSELLTGISASPLQPAPVQDNDLAFMLYTSGSTGTPKGVPHRHADLVTVAEHYAIEVLGMQESDTVFSASKLYFAYGLGNSLAFPLYVGATAVLHSGIALPEKLLSLMEKHRPTLFFAVPTVYTQIIRSISRDHLSLPMRLCISAGESLPTAVLKEWQCMTGLDVLDCIGSTEMTHAFISNRQGRISPGSAGRPVPGYEVRLVNDAGDTVPSGTEGHLLVRGPSSAPYYWNQEKKTAETMLSDGFIRTGDVFLEQDGIYFHRGRSDDMLKVDGQWVSPIQVEDVLRSHPAVADCAVAACRIGGLERAAAHLILQSAKSPQGQLEKELRSFMSSKLPDYMCPMKYHFVEDLPRTPTGKVQRFKLKQSI